MKSTFAGRRAWILNDTPTVSEVINVFPSLKLSSRVSAYNIYHCLAKRACGRYTLHEIQTVRGGGVGPTLQASLLLTTKCKKQYETLWA